MVGTYLVANFMGYIVDVEIIALGNAICRGGDTTAFAIGRSDFVDANATDTSGIATTATRSKHMTNIVIGFTHISNQRIFQLHIPVSECGIRVCATIVINDVGGVCNQVEVHRQVFFEDAVATGEGIVEGCENQAYLCRTGSTEKVSIFTVAGQGEAVGFQVTA